MIYQLKITLKQVSPPVWRRIQVDANTTFLVLHQLIQEAFNWEDVHLHEFSLKSETENQLSLFGVDNLKKIGPVNVDGFGPILDEAEEIIGNHLREAKDKALYIYDLSDDWQHEILLENVLYPERGVAYPRCLKVKGLASEEDVDMWEDEEELEARVNEETVVREINNRFEEYVVETEEDYESIMEQENWHALFRMIDTYKDLKPWYKFWDSQIIVIDLPDVEERAYCSILGRGGVEIGLAVYLGDSGLNTLRKVVGDPDMFSEEDVLAQRSLLFSLSDRDELEKVDYTLIKSLGLGFRGKNQWPLFRSYKPGYFPWVIDQDEVRILTGVLEQINEVFGQFKTDPLQIPEYGSGQWFARFPSVKGREVSWENTMITPEFQEANKESAAIHISELEIKRLKKRCKPFNGIIEFDAHYFPQPIMVEEVERPYFPPLVLGADPNEGMLFFNKMLGPEQYEQSLQVAFIEMVEGIDGIPAEVQIENAETLRILEQLLEALSIRMVKVDELAVITHFRREMADGIANSES